MNIFITGGTSGIGLSLAEKYLAKGNRVGICGRHTDNLHLKDIDKYLKIYQLDVFDRVALETAIRDFSAEGGLDLLIASAGCYADESTHALSYEESALMLKTNIVGTINALDAAREVMRGQSHGHLAAIASASGMFSYRDATIYSKTKRAIIQICDAYRRALGKFNIRVTVIMPGYVDTPSLRRLNDGDLSRKPFVVSVDEASDTIIQAIAEGKESVFFPRKMRLLIGFLTLLPDRLLSFILQKNKEWTHRKR